MYRVVVHRRSARYLKKLPPDQRNRVKSVLEQMRDDPAGLVEVKRMVGNWAGYCRVRVGDIRILFWGDDSERIVFVDHIGQRGDIYK